MSIFTDIRQELMNDPTLQGFIGQRVFWRNPIDVPSDSYITMHRTGKRRPIATQKDFIRLICYSKSMSDLENITSRIVDLFEGKTYLNGNNYYAMPLINQVDSDQKLQDAFYFSIMTFEFNSTT